MVKPRTVRLEVGTGHRYEVGETINTDNHAYVRRKMTNDARMTHAVPVGGAHL